MSRVGLSKSRHTYSLKVRSCTFQTLLQVTYSQLTNLLGANTSKIASLVQPAMFPSTVPPHIPLPRFLTKLKWLKIPQSIHYKLLSIRLHSYNTANLVISITSSILSNSIHVPLALLLKSPYAIQQLSELNLLTSVCSTPFPGCWKHFLTSYAYILRQSAI